VELRRVWWLCAAILAIGCGSQPETTALRPSDVKSDLEVLAKSRVYFGHQSVGNNLLAGLTSLSATHNVPLRIVSAPAPDEAPGIVHAIVGRNREPQTKCDAFARFLTEQGTARWDAAILKFCYADMGEGGEQNPNRVLDGYKAAVRSARTARPDLLIVHATMPLQSEGLGKRDAIRKFFGFGTSNDAHNVVRNKYNDLLRAEYAGEPLIDLAWAESTRPDGTRTGFHRDGQFIYAMAREFTYDEGHLSDAGKEWVAREFVRSLADALRPRMSRGPEGSDATTRRQ